MIKKLLIVSLFAASAFATATTASAGEGHWSIGKGVQCKTINGVVVCSKSRP